MIKTKNNIRKDRKRPRDRMIKTKNNIRKDRKRSIG